MRLFDCFWRAVRKNCTLVRAIRVPREDVELAAYYLAESEGFSRDPREYWLEAEFTLVFARLIEAR